jgi:hypothetical protein
MFFMIVDFVVLTILLVYRVSTFSNVKYMNYFFFIISRKLIP